jgi:glycosyltransferase involved in cell wall biosynthesis
LKLSICIATYKRAAFIGATLDSVLAQLEPGVELLVVDGASPDDTPQVVARAAARCPQLRYFRETENSGVDRDYDKAVGYARGDYCWLMTDDDLLAPGAVRRVLEALVDGPDLVVVNAEVRNVDLTRTLVSRRLAVETDFECGAERSEELFERTVAYLSFIGAVVIRRDAWQARERAPYYGSLFIHVGVIFQRPALRRVKVVAEPLVVIRNGNAMWTPRSFEIWTFKWPALLWSFPGISEAAKRAVAVREPWRRFRYLMLCRALGSYSIAEFRGQLSGRARGAPRAFAWIAARCPGALANLAAVLYFGLFHRARRTELYDLLGSSRAGAASRVAARALGVYLR